MTLESGGEKTLRTVIERFANREQDSTWSFFQVVGQDLQLYSLPTPEESELLAEMGAWLEHGDELSDVFSIAEISQRVSYSLLGFARRMGTLALRTDSKETVQAAALALSFDDPHVDYRDLQMSLEVVLNAAWRLSDGPDAWPTLFRFSFGERMKSVSKFIRAFAKEKPSRLPNFHLVETPQGPSYVEKRFLRECFVPWAILTE